MERFYALGKTDNNRLLFIAFTLRKQKIRIISGRDMSKKERLIYEKKAEAEENKFWLKHDSSYYIEWANSKSVILPE